MPKFDTPPRASGDVFAEQRRTSAVLSKKAGLRRMSNYDCHPIFPRTTARLFVDAMHLLIILAVLEAVAVIFAVSLCVAARRTDERTERTLSRDEVEARRQVSGANRPSHLAPFRKRMTWRWLTAILRTGDHDKHGS